MHTFIERLIGALKLDVATYEEVEQDPEALRQAAIIVAASALIGGLVGGAIHPDSFVSGFVGQFLSALVGWVVWSAVVWFVGTRLFSAEADLPEMLRVLGFAYAPSLLAAIPCVNVLVFFWLLATGFVAARAGLDLDNAKTLITIVVGVVVMMIVMLAIMIPLGIGYATLGALTGR